MIKSDWSIIWAWGSQLELSLGNGANGAAFSYIRFLSYITLHTFRKKCCAFLIGYPAREKKREPTKVMQITTRMSSHWRRRKLSAKNIMGKERKHGFKASTRQGSTFKRWVAVICVGCLQKSKPRLCAALPPFEGVAPNSFLSTSSSAIVVTFTSFAKAPGML